jgi:WD40 repeat protein
LVGNVGGDVILFSSKSLSDLAVELAPGRKSIMKSVKVHNGPVSFISSTESGLIVTGGADGIFKMYDSSFRVVFWYDQLHAGAITNIIFNPHRQCKKG